MDQDQNYFLFYNKHFEEKIDHLIHTIDRRVNKLYELRLEAHQKQINSSTGDSKGPNAYSNNTFLTFKAPYIRDFRKFSGPTNQDVRSIRELTGTENIDLLIKNKHWSKENKQQLVDAVLDHYAQLHIIELIKQKNLLNQQLTKGSSQNSVDVKQKLSLIDGQIEQVRARKDQRIFVPENRCDFNIDWCSISAKLKSTHHDANDCRLLWSNEMHWTINKNSWTKDEDACLLNAVQRLGKNDWDSVARELNNNRLPWQCCARYQQAISSASSSTPISDDDADKIIEIINLCRIGNFVPWNQVMYFIQYHSLLQVKYQWHKILSARNSNLPWTSTEDALLLKAVDKFGDRDWLRISSYIPGRSNKSCRERFVMRLNYQSRVVGHWLPKEDSYLMKMVNHFGTNWSLIASHFPDRNNHQIRSRYELLKTEQALRAGSVKRRKLLKDVDGSLSVQRRRAKPASKIEIDQKLAEIFSAYSPVNTSAKSLVCRSAQDEFIFHNLVSVLANLLRGDITEQTALSAIISKALIQRVTTKFDIFMPSVSTLTGYKAWKLQQDYLAQFSEPKVDMEQITSSQEYKLVLKMIVSIFMLPAVLSRVSAPAVSSVQFESIIGKDPKSLYKIREIQRQLTSSKLPIT